jgi:hypothetical protein
MHRRFGTEQCLHAILDHFICLCRPHDRSLADAPGPLVTVIEKEIDPPAKPVGLSRQQRRAEQRLLKKVRR